MGGEVNFDSNRDVSNAWLHVANAITLAKYNIKMISNHFTNFTSKERRRRGWGNGLKQIEGKYSTSID